MRGTIRAGTNKSFSTMCSANQEPVPEEFRVDSLHRLLSPLIIQKTYPKSLLSEVEYLDGRYVRGETEIRQCF